MSTSTASDHTKLTVAQLKALCKERRITGYSKLSKPVLIQRLLDAEGQIVAPIPLDPSALLAHSLPARKTGLGTGNSSNSIPPSGLQVSCEAPPSRDPGLQSDAYPGRFDCPDDNPTSAGGTSHVSRNVAPTTASSSAVHLYVATIRPGSGVSVPALDNLATVHASTTPTAASTSAKRPGSRCTEHPAKRTKPQTSLPNASGKPFVVVEPSLLRFSNPVNEIIPSICPSSSYSPERIAATYVNASINSTPPPRLVKRFKPLIARRQLNQHAMNPGCRQSIPNVTPVAKSPLVLPPACFEFQTLQFEAELKPISLPPPLSQRKRVQGWAIVLSGLDNQSRNACSLVSRTFRYAVYLSATPILRRKFSGQRLDTDTSRYSQAMTNLWPYLRFRHDEATRNKRIYEHSFLYRLANGGKANAISSHLWGSPDNGKQLKVAVRFALSSLWFAMSVGGRESEAWLQGTIVGAEEVIEGEIWMVTVQNRDRYTTAVRCSSFYVLEQTCEVIGRPHPAATGPSALELRADWTNYIKARLADAPPGVVSGSSLLQTLKWAHHEEYERGISKLWMRRLEKEGDLGKVKNMVAERYILACVVENSVSGVWMSTTQMAQEFAALPNRSEPSLRKPGYHTFPVNLYLPAPHHVESVHFATSSKTPLHPALAVIQTPPREYYVLRDNGMQVGSEEEGVAAIWMEAIGCDSRGLPV